MMSYQYMSRKYLSSNRACAICMSLHRRRRPVRWERGGVWGKKIDIIPSVTDSHNPTLYTCPFYRFAKVGQSHTCETGVVGLEKPVLTYVSIRWPLVKTMTHTVLDMGAKIPWSSRYKTLEKKIHHHQLTISTRLHTFLAKNFPYGSTCHMWKKPVKLFKSLNWY